MKRYDAVVFDLDGTLLDTLQDLADSVNYALRAFHLPERPLQDIRAFVGNGVGMLVHRAVPPGTEPAREAECLTCFRGYYLANMAHKTAPYPGVPELLDRLSAAGRKVAVVSNKFDGAVKVLCAHYFGARVPVCIGASVHVAQKPAPDTVFQALRALETAPERAVYIGDSDVDILTAHNAGLPCISVTWGFRDRAFLTAHGATELVDTVEELKQVLRLD